jgi:hypothetical protein
VKLVTLVAFQVPEATMGGADPPPSSPPPVLAPYRVKLPLPVTEPPGSTEPAPSRSSRSVPPDWRSVTLKVKFREEVGGGVVEVTVRVTLSITGLFEAPLEVNVTVPA